MPGKKSLPPAIDPSSPRFTPVVSPRAATITLKKTIVKELLPLIALFIVIALYAAFKVGLMQCNPGYTPAEDKGMFWSETAYQYRYAKMFAENDPHVWQTLKRDTRLQYPDGVDTWKDYTTFMEPFDGLAYRIFAPKNIPFHVFLLWFVALFSSLTALLIYTVCCALWKDRIIAFIAALSWMLMPASFMRQVSAVYLKEDFSLFFVAAFILLFIVSIEDKRRRIAILGGASLFIALASWHLSQFFFLLLMGCAALFFIFRTEWEKHWTRNILVYLAFALAAACLPVLRQRAFIISQSMILCYALLAAIIIKKRFEKGGVALWWQKVAILGGAFFVFALSDLPFVAHFKEYAHVFELFIYKVRYLGVMPSDPSALPFEARVFWAGDFDGATFDTLITAFRWYAPFIAAVPLFFLLGAARKKLTRQEEFVGVLLLGAGFIYWLVDRLSVFFAPILAVSLCVIPLLLFRMAAKKKGCSRSAKTSPFAWAAYAFFGIIMVLNFIIVNKMKPVIGEIAANKTELFDWIHANTGADDPFVGNFSDGPMILLYTGRPVVLNSQYENSFIRKRTVEFYKAYFGSEDDLHAFCTKYGIRYVMARAAAAIDDKPGADRWNAAFIGPLPEKCAAALIQFAPQTMTRFAPVFDNAAYRIVQVLRSGEKPATPWKRGYSPRFDASLFEKKGSFFVNTDLSLKRLDAADELLRDAGPLFSQMVQEYQANAADRGSKIADLAREKLRKAAMLDPKDHMIYYNGAILEAESGNLPAAVDKAAQALSIAPSDRLIQQMFFDFATRTGQWELSEIAGKKLLDDPANFWNRPFLQQHIADAALSRKEYAAAAAYADSALAGITLPDNSGCNRGMLYYILAAAAFRQGDVKRAQAALSACAKLSPDTEVRQRVEELIAEANANAAKR
jgi:tetratricopeptide (TPR) repeat protein